MAYQSWAIHPVQFGEYPEPVPTGSPPGWQVPTRRFHCLGWNLRDASEIPCPLYWVQASHGDPPFFARDLDGMPPIYLRPLCKPITTAAKIFLFLNSARLNSGSFSALLHTCRASFSRADGAIYPDASSICIEIDLPTPEGRHQNENFVLVCFPINFFYLWSAIWSYLRSRTRSFV